MFTCRTALRLASGAAPVVRRPLLVLRHNDYVPAGRLTDVAQNAGVELDIIAFDQGQTLERVGDISRIKRTYSGVVSLGGSMGAYEDHLHKFLTHEKQLLRDAVGQGIPTLGICLGAQILADCLGGGRAFRAPFMEAGYVPIWLTPAGRAHACMRALVPPRSAAISSPEKQVPTHGVYLRKGDAMTQGLQLSSSGTIPGSSLYTHMIDVTKTAETCSVLNYHNDTFRLPDGATLLAASRFYPAAFTCGSALAVQFHPEASPDILWQWMTRIGTKSVLAIGMDPAALHREAQDRIAETNAAGYAFLKTWMKSLS